MTSGPGMVPLVPSSHESPRAPGAPPDPGRGGRWWPLLAGVVALVVVLVAAVVGLRAGPSTAPSRAALRPSPVQSPAPFVPTPSPAPSSIGPAVTLAASGSPLAAVPAPTVVPVAQNTDCRALVPAGWTGVCAPEQMAGGTAIWMVARRPTASSTVPAWQVSIFLYSATAGGWYPSLSASDPGGSRWTNVTATAVDLTGDGLPEIVVGYRLKGPRETLEYDIVGFPVGGAPRVLAHVGGLGRGSAVVAGGVVDDYAAEYPNGAPVCCPVDFLERTVGWTGAAFQATPVARVPPTAVPSSAF